MSGAHLRIAVLAAALCGGALAWADETRGVALYAQCATCHGARGEGNVAVRAPALAGLPEWYVARQLHSFRTGRRGAESADLYGTQMARMAQQLWDDAEVATVAAYVASLEPAASEPTLRGGKASRGKDLYAPCAACHSPDAAGNAEVGAPPLRGREDWYMVDELTAFRTGTRGTDAADPAALAMREAAMALADEQAVLDVATHLATLTARAEARARR